jgi:hypothetical protein
VPYVFHRAFIALEDLINQIWEPMVLAFCGHLIPDLWICKSNDHRTIAYLGQVIHAFRKNLRPMRRTNETYDLALVRRASVYGKLMKLLAEIFVEATDGGNEDGGKN